MIVKDKPKLKRVSITHLKHDVKHSYYSQVPDVAIQKEVNTWYNDCEKAYVKDGALILIIATGKGKTKEIGFSLSHIIKWEVI